MKVNSLHYISILTLLFLVLGCAKDEGTPKSKTELITGKKFFLRAWTIDPPISYSGNIISNLYGNLNACEKDDFRVFNEDGTVVFDDGIIKCETGTPQTETGAWAFVEGETVLQLIYPNGLSQFFKIEELKTGNLKLSLEFSDDLGSGLKTYTYFYTYRTE